MSIDAACQKLLQQYRERPTLRVSSLITTVFGDAILPRGGTVWLGSLIAALAEFGVSERLVRTSVFRLAKDGWLQSTQVGRRSYYSLTDDGRERFAQATHRIYSAPISAWDGQWCLLLLSGLNAEIKDVVRKECGWLGFGALSANLLAHPAPDMVDLEVTVHRLGLEDQLVVMSGSTVHSEPAMRKIAIASWNLVAIDRRYREFLDMFRPVYAAIRKRKRVEPDSGFVIRTLLIQEYRKILLRDPHLPTELLPAHWLGTSSYQLCRNLYRAVFVSADRFLSATLENTDGPLPPVNAVFRERFGGLQ